MSNQVKQATPLEREVPADQRSAVPRLKPKWDVVIFVSLIHLGVLLAPFTFTWSAFWLCLGLMWATGWVGIALCYHRLLTHRSFKVSRWLEYLLAFCGVLAAQGGPIWWVSTHRLHHAYSDTPKDPHSPVVNSFWWGHMGWFLHHDPRRAQCAALDLARDPVHRFLERTQGLWPVLLGVLLYALGGLPWLIWGFSVRTVVVYHVTWSVNSAAHTWGYQSYQTNDRSTNCWWVALLSFGEGWHNNHHAFPRSAAHGLRWWELDLTYLTIRAFAVLGLAQHVVVPDNTRLA